MGISQLREFRIRTGGTFNSTFTNAASTTWNTTNSTKIRVVALDDSGLEQPGLADETLQTRRFAKNAPYAGLRKGSLKFTTYAAGAEASTAKGVMGQLLHTALGGYQSAGAGGRTAAIGAGSSTTNINLTSANTYVVAGQAVLVGKKGDAKGNGRVKVVLSADNGGMTYWPACDGAPTAGDAIVVSDTAYPDQSASKNYIDTLMIGDDTNDQRQTIGGSLMFTITGTAPGELPKCEWDCMVADHQWVPTGDLATADDTTTPSGANPAHERGIGMVHLSQTTRSTAVDYLQAGDFTIDTGLQLLEVPQPTGVNGVGGHVIGVSQASIEFTCTFDEDMPGLADDFNARTSKSIIVQFGHTGQRTFAIEMQKCYIDSLPQRATINGLTGSKIKLMSDEDITSGTTELNRAPFRIHIF